MRKAIKYVLNTLAFLVFVWMCIVVLKLVTPYAHSHEFYSKWMKPHKPTESCCNNRDCFEVEGRKLPNGRYQAFVDGEWIDIPPEIVLDPLKPENQSPGGYHLCRDPLTKELFCFREEEVKM